MPGDKPKVMVVDDDPLALEVARERLESAGYEVVVRDRALGTSQAVLYEQPDVILLDVMMPGLSGDALAALLKGHARTRQTAIVLHSSKRQTDLSDLLVTTGAIGAIQKTSDDEAFLTEFERLVRHSRRPSDPKR